jgi:hypothetical protein
MKILSWIALAPLASRPLLAQDDFWDEDDARKACEPFEHYQPGSAARGDRGRLPRSAPGN